jgi:hypothetical protein
MKNALLDTAASGVLSAPGDDMLPENNPSGFSTAVK